MAVHTLELSIFLLKTHTISKQYKDNPMPTTVKTIECINASKHEGFLEGEEVSKDKIIANPIVDNSH